MSKHFGMANIQSFIILFVPIKIEIQGPKIHAWRTFFLTDPRILHLTVPVGSNLSVKLSDFTVTSYLTKKMCKLRSFDRQIAQASEMSFPVVFYTENCAVHSGNPTVSSVYSFIHHSHTHEKTHRTGGKKNDKPDGKPVLCYRTFSSVFSAVYFYTVKLHSLT